MEKYTFSSGEHRLIRAQANPEQNNKPKEAAKSPEVQQKESAWDTFRKEAKDLHDKLEAYNPEKGDHLDKHAEKIASTCLNIRKFWKIEEGKESAINAQSNSLVDKAMEAIKQGEEALANEERKNEIAKHPIHLQEHASNAPDLYSKVVTFDVPKGVVPYFSYVRYEGKSPIIGHGYSLSNGAVSLNDRDVARIDRVKGPGGDKFTLGLHNKFRGTLAIWINGKQFNVESGKPAKPAKQEKQRNAQALKEEVAGYAKKSVKNAKEKKTVGEKKESEKVKLDDARRALQSFYHEIESNVNVDVAAGLIQVNEALSKMDEAQLKRVLDASDLDLGKHIERNGHTYIFAWNEGTKKLELQDHMGDEEEETSSDFKTEMGKLENVIDRERKTDPDSWDNAIKEAEDQISAEKEAANEANENDNMQSAKIQSLVQTVSESIRQAGLEGASMVLGQLNDEVKNTNDLAINLAVQDAVANGILETPILSATEGENMFIQWDGDNRKFVVAGSVPDAQAYAEAAANEKLKDESDI